MSTSGHDELHLKSVGHLLGYFDQQVLAAYRNEPHKYRIESDYFEGELCTTNEYFDELERAERTSEFVSIRFGYRTLRDGNLAIVAWLPDLFERSKTHVPRWSAFHLRNPQWAGGEDERFDKWVMRYLEGSWDVESGPVHSLGQTIKIINALTIELVGMPLYKNELDETLSFPAAENTHRYQDAHRELYGYLIDGLDKACMSCISSKLGRHIKIDEKKTIKAITELFPGLENSEAFMPATNVVIQQRRLASHSVRPPAENFPAFSQFTKDLSHCLEAVKEVLAVLEREFGVSGEEMHKLHEAKKLLPRIDRQSDPYYSIVQASRMEGKTVKKVEYGFREQLRGAHQSEALIIHFTDGSIMSLETGSNAGNVSSDENRLRPEDFHVDFIVHWVPEPPEGTQTKGL